MGDISKSDVQAAVRDGLNDIKIDIKRIRDDVQKIEQRTNDLDQSQEDIKRLVQQLETVARQMTEVYHDADKIDRVVIEIGDLKNQLVSSVHYLQQISQYLGALDQRFRAKFGDSEDDGYRKA
jgi:methyl-accepting chemotaxis protein